MTTLNNNRVLSECTQNCDLNNSVSSILTLFYNSYLGATTHFQNLPIILYAICSVYKNTYLYIYIYKSIVNFYIFFTESSWSLGIHVKSTRPRWPGVLLPWHWPNDKGWLPLLGEDPEVVIKEVPQNKINCKFDLLRWFVMVPHLHFDNFWEFLLEPSFAFLWICLWKTLRSYRIILRLYQFNPFPYHPWDWHIYTYMNCWFLWVFM